MTMTLDKMDDDALAAEYVLGVLDAADRAAAEERMRSDADFALRVDGWQARLAPLNEAYDAVPPPVALQAQIEARLFPAQPVPRRRSGWLGGILAGLGVAAVVLVAVALWLGVPGTDTRLQAVLTAEDAPVAFVALWSETEGVLTLRQTAGGPAGEGADYQLWRIGADGVPQSLGLVQGDLALALPALAQGEVLAVSLEPAGGSPLPGPSGPVLLAAPLETM